MFKSGGQGAPSSSRSFDWYDCTCNVRHICTFKTTVSCNLCSPTKFFDWNSKTCKRYEKTKHDKIYLFFSSFFLQLTMNDFSVHRIIGRGGFGEVYGCRKADTGKM